MFRPEHSTGLKLSVSLRRFGVFGRKLIVREPTFPLPSNRTDEQLLADLKEYTLELAAHRVFGNDKLRRRLESAIKQTTKELLERLSGAIRPEQNHFTRGRAPTAARSRKEIQERLAPHGAKNLEFSTNHGETLTFTVGTRTYTFLVVPAASHGLSVTGLRRSLESVRQAQENSRRQRWMAVLSLVTAKLAAVESGALFFEHAFASEVVAIDGRALHEILDSAEYLLMKQDETFGV